VREQLWDILLPVLHTRCREAQAIRLEEQNISSAVSTRSVVRFMIFGVFITDCSSPFYLSHVI